MPNQIQQYINDSKSVFGNNGGVTPAGANTAIATSPTVGPGAYEVDIWFEFTGALGAADIASNLQFAIVPTVGSPIVVRLMAIPAANTVAAFLISHATVRADMGVTTFQVQSVTAGTTAIYNAVLMWTGIAD